jgi:hypothetical protein
MELKTIKTEKNINDNSKLKQQHEKVQDILKDLKKKQTNFFEDEERLKYEAHRLNIELNKINSEIEEKKDKINELLDSEANDTNSSAEGIPYKCEKILNYFLKSVLSNTFYFKIEYDNIFLEGKLEPNEDYTFYNLKQKMKNHFNRNEKEFCFTDENGYIFIDELSVRKSLFPLSEVVVHGYIPIIKFKEKRNSIRDVGYTNIKRGGVQSGFTNLINNVIKLKDEAIASVKENKFNIFNICVFFVFIVFWIYSSIFFRNAFQYNMLTKSFEKSYPFMKDYIDVNINLF